MLVNGRHFDYSRNMNQTCALLALDALSHETRLAVFRLLVQRGPDPTPAMEVGRLLDLKPSTVSGHLSALRKAGLVSTARAHREVRYAPRLEVINDLVRFLLQDCCGGDEAACAGLIPQKV
jgi:DNA-binding transcriptional ArsR family regulator